MTLANVNCPHCGHDLIDEWMQVEATWQDGELVSQSLDCPHCGRDMTDVDIETILTAIPNFERFINELEQSKAGKGAGDISLIDDRIRSLKQLARIVYDEEMDGD